MAAHPADDVAVAVEASRIHGADMSAVDRVVLRKFQRMPILLMEETNCMPPSKKKKPMHAT